MKKIALLFILAACLVACSSNDDSGDVIQNVDVALSFTQNFDGQPIDVSSFNATPYTNANGDVMTFTRLRYLITDIAFTAANGEIYNPAQKYILVNVSEGSGLTSNNTSIPQGNYNVSLRFGFTEAENTTNTYTDLNSASWNVPEPMGGGYHYQQLDGKFIDNAGTESPFNYHTISAPTDAMTPMVTREDTSIAINLGMISITNSNTIIEVKANIAEWFKNPNTWDLNELNTALMGNTEAQLMMAENGKNVFSLGSVN